MARVRALLQRVSKAAVSVEGECVGSIGRGLCVLVGAGHDDERRDAELLAERLCNLRIFEDDNGRMNRSLLDVGGGMLVISQFTLMADTRRGRRPSFVAAAEPERAHQLIEHLITCAARHDVELASGRFGAHMDIDIAADGPVTIMLDSKDRRSA